MTAPLSLPQRFDQALRLIAQGRPQQAESALRAVLQQSPEHGEAQHRLGLLLAQYGHPEAALEHLARAEVLLAGRADVRINFATVCQLLGRFDQALQLLESAQATGAKAPELFYNLGVVRQALLRFSSAAEAFAEARRLSPAWAEAWMSEGNCRLNAGQAEVARAVLAEALALHPEHGGIASNYLLTLNYCASIGPEALSAAHRQWGARQGQTIAGRAEKKRQADKPPAKPGQSGKGRIRLGFVSPNLADHAVAYFLEPLLDHLDRQRFEALAYTLSDGSDPVTERLRPQFSQWRNAARLDDAALARRIADDRVDVLIDLAGHTAHNRLALFARRPAARQWSMIGYPSTTGLAAIDHCLSDATLDPPEEAGAAYVEALHRLPLFCCYRPPGQAITPGELPMLRRGYPTLGSFQSLAKLSDPTLDVWCELLARVPAARLQLRALGAADPEAVAVLSQRFAARGISGERIEVLGFAGFDDFLNAHREIDLCLDTLPWNGHTTTCHALWMGVPTLSLRGDRRAGRMGQALLQAVGLCQFVVEQPGRFAEQGAALLADPAGLAAIRRDLRQRLLASPLCDGRAYAEGVMALLEAAVPPRGAQK